MRAKKLVNNLYSKKETFAKFIHENYSNKPLIKLDNNILNKELKLSLNYLVDNWEKGFYKLKHKMYFSPQLGFKSTPLQVGDIFQRAIIATHFKTIVNNIDAYELKDIINFEKEYLKSNKYNEVGWKYFPDLLELPCDSDDLAQIMQVFTGSNQEEIESLFKTPLTKLLKNSNEPLFKTWIYSTENNELEMQSTKNEWGDTHDVDVISNIGYAIFSNLNVLNFLVRNKSLEILKKNAIFVSNRQHKKGYWESTWYDDVYYGTYVSTRFLNSFQQHSDSVDKALMFLKKNQNVNGSWGNLKKKNLLNTAIVLLTFYESKKEESYKEAIVKGAEYILSNKNIDGSYSSDNFIKMEVGRSKDLPNKILYYKSDVLTTSYCLTALSYVYRKET
ncbi:prenyltransferase/squalene oxidase repeat-containing protein [Gaetbulibacter sp. M240]|uniref:prenyltransferase/squalene oxidase repeat-containing protein n=1 Tax=Gaetbulibacter sp. M240 TaxID=3126511 RepID=UPI00374E8060